MDWSRVGRLFRHELLQYMANKKQLASIVVGVLVLLVASGLVIAAMLAAHEHLDSPLPGSRTGGSQAGHGDEGISLGEVGEIVLSFAMLFVCGTCPVSLGATAVVGEKEHRTLESLLLLPTSEREILLGKVVPAALLPIVACWLCCGVVAGAGLLLLPSQSLRLLLNHEFVVTALLTAPAFAAMSALWATIPSVLVADTKAAQQLCLMPALGIMMGALFLYGRVMISNPGSIVYATLCVLVLDVVLFSVAVRLFNRERLLLRYE